MAANDIPSSSRSLALDPRALDRLRTNAGAAPEKALREAAKQFEVLFMNMLLKSMRDAAPQDGPLDSDQTRMYTGMLDQQLAQAMGSRGIGLADIMVRQLSRNAATVSAEKSLTTGAPGSATEPTPVTEKPATQGTSEVAPRSSIASRSRDFVNRFWPHALEASRETGLPAQFILGQAALESGWGARETRGADGAPTHNLFNIKAGQAWRGGSAEAATTEYVGGGAQKVVGAVQVLRLVRRGVPGLRDAAQDQQPVCGRASVGQRSGPVRARAAEGRLRDRSRLCLEAHTRHHRQRPARRAFDVIPKFAEIEPLKG